LFKNNKIFLNIKNKNNNYYILIMGNNFAFENTTRHKYRFKD
jgi:hypothetical protein